MNPKIWGRGGWCYLFTIIYYYINILNNCNSQIYYIKFEELKFLIYIYVSNLPCKLCVEHSIQNINKNNIMSTNDPNIVLHMFIQLYNEFHPNNKIDRNKISLIKLLK
jgi:hypothetical protein